MLAGTVTFKWQLITIIKDLGLANCKLHITFIIFTNMQIHRPILRTSVTQITTGCRQKVEAPRNHFIQ